MAITKIESIVMFSANDTKRFVIFGTTLFGEQLRSRQAGHHRHQCSKQVIGIPDKRQGGELDQKAGW